MQIFYSDSPITIVVPFTREDGTVVTAPTSVNYTVTDANGIVVLSETGLTPNPDAESQEITLNAMQTALPVGVVRDLRMVQLVFTADGLSSTVYQEILLERRDALIVGVNSYQSYESGILGSRDLAEVEPFMAAERSARITAMINAWHNLNSLRYFAGGRELADLSTLTPEDFAALPSKFLRQLRLAQIVEANELLSGATMHKRRQAGVLSETIGESSMMWRPEKVLLIPVTRRSLDLLRGYVVWEMGVGRA